MIKLVEFTTRAKKDLLKLEKFNDELYGKEKSNIILKNLLYKLEILENPNADLTKIGVIDTSFNHLKRTYRKLIVNYCKITYRVGKTKIYIVRVFDTRQNPFKNK
jgi:hypothetical protein